MSEFVNAKELIRPHIDSYNFMLDKGLALAVHDLPPMEVSSVVQMVISRCQQVRTVLHSVSGFKM